MPVTRDDVISAYRFLLNRDPENEAAIAFHSTAESWIELRHNFMVSPEYRYSHGYLDKWMVAPVFGDTMLLWVNMRDKYVSVHCAMDNYEADNSALVRKLLKPGDIFLDLGANIGWFTLLASSIVGPAGHVHSFEPQPNIAAHLRRSIELNRITNVTLHNAGVWREPGSMFLAWHEHAENHGASHLIPGDSSDEGGSKVELVALDGLRLDRCDLIKMDIEGAEPEAMQGAARLLERCRPVILSELNIGQLAAVSNASLGGYVEQMERRGYRCLGARDELAGCPIGPTTQLDRDFTDVLFIPEEKLDRLRGDLFGTG